jgi:multidrug efflux pump subunit AcrA (membrane-fusion protein)
LKKTKQSLLTQKGKFSLTAPFDGIIEKVYVVQGQMAGPSTGIIMLVGKKERKVVAKISETYLKNLKKDSQVSVEFPVLGESMDSLEVTRVGGFVDPVNRTIDLDVKLKNFNANKHVPNLMANIKVRDKVVPNALLIPSKVILKGSEQSSYVYVLTKNVEKSNDSIPRYEVSKKVIKIGDMYNGKTIVVEGLKVGDIVVDRGRGDVSEGSIVEVSDF